MNFFKKIFRKSNNDKLDKSLEKTSSSFIEKIKKVVVGKTKVDATTLDDLEEVLITSDIGVKTTLKIIDSIEERVKKEKYTNALELDTILKEEISNIIFDNSDSDAYEIKEKPHVILVVGVNGSGKTTTIAKLAYLMKNNGARVILGAADTFRAAATQQLEVWAKKLNLDIVSLPETKDAASVAFETIKIATENNYDTAIIDTAGRLQNRSELMDELAKIIRVIKKYEPQAPHSILLTLDATAGQNAIQQAKVFNEIAKITGLIVKNPKGSIFLLFHQVQQKMDIEQKNLFLKYDITPRQFIVLQTIDFQPGSNQNEIVKSINIDRSTLSKIIEKLESKNYISSQHKEGDKRHKQLSITTKGRSTLRRLQQDVKDLENIFIKEIELDTKKKFLSSLRSYVTNK